MSQPYGVVLLFTVPFKDIFKVDGVGDPLASQERLCETPDADVHGPSSGFGGQASEVDRLPAKHVGLPALTFVCGELNHIDRMAAVLDGYNDAPESRMV